MGRVALCCAGRRSDGVNILVRDRHGHGAPAEVGVRYPAALGGVHQAEIIAAHRRSGVCYGIVIITTACTELGAGRGVVDLCARVAAVRACDLINARLAAIREIGVYAEFECLALLQATRRGREGGVHTVVIVKLGIGYLQAFQHIVLVGDVGRQLRGGGRVREALVRHVELPASRGLNGHGAACLRGHSDLLGQDGSQLFQVVLGGKRGVHTDICKTQPCALDIRGRVVVDLEEIDLVADLGGLACGLVRQARDRDLVVRVVLSCRGVVIRGLCKADVGRACRELAVCGRTLIALAAFQVRDGHDNSRGVGDGDLACVKVKVPAADRCREQLCGHISRAGEGVGGVGHRARA